MLVDVEDNFGYTVNPETCRLVGKECRDCVASSASVVALLCPSLDAASAQNMFFRMYRNQGCVGMARAFVRGYLEEVEPDAFDSIPEVISVAYQVAACA